MFKTLVLAASLGLSMSAAQACGLMKSVQTDATSDSTIVASITKQQAQPMTTTVKKLPPETLPETLATAGQQPAEPLAK